MSFAQLSVIVSVIVWSFSFTAQATSLKMATRAGKIFSLDVQGDRVTTKTSEFVVCGDHVDLVKKMKLWMNEHNHGSTPVLMGPVSDGCRSISKVNFTMTGEWDVRVELNDGDFGAFVVEVDQE